MNIKEINFIKQVERTCKHDAYQAVLSWSKSDTISKENIIWFLEQKIQGHKEYLDSLPLRYDYATQTLVTK